MAMAHHWIIRKYIVGIIRTAMAILLFSSGAAMAAEKVSAPTYDALTTLDVEVANGIATVSIDHGPVNLIDVQLMTDLGQLAGMLMADSDVKVVVFESNVDGFFMARADVALLERLKTLEGPSTEVSPFHQLMEAYKRMPKVTIAKIDGIARGAGSEFALALDMRFASDRAVFGQPEIAFGLQPGGGGLVRLPEVMNRGRALEVILSGRDFSATEAAEYGWVNKTLPADELDTYVNDLAVRIASYDAAALARAKTAFVAVEEAQGTQKLLVEFDLFVAAVQSPAGRETVDAVLELGPATAQSETDLHETIADAKSN